MMAVATQTSETISTRPRFPRQGEWTYQDWYELPNDGWRYEILEGVLNIMPPPATYHQDSAMSLAARMRMHAEERELGVVLMAPCGVKLPQRNTAVEPDILFVRQSRRHIITRKEVDGSPDLVVEVISPSSRHYDRQTKFELYQHAGVAEYWLVNYQRKTVEVFNLVAGQYQFAGKFGVEETAHSTVLTDFSVSVKLLFTLS